MEYELIRSVFALHQKVTYNQCRACLQPLPAQSFAQHECRQNQTSLLYQVTPFSAGNRSSYFSDRVPQRGFISALRLWTGQYLTAIEIEIEDFQSRTLKTIKRGIPQPENQHSELLFYTDEFIVKLAYGCDFFGVFGLKLTTNHGRILQAGNPRCKLIEMGVPEGSGVVGMFGAFSSQILHIGFFFDNMKEVFFSRFYELLLVRYKGKEPENEEGKKMDILRKVDDGLFWYICQFM